MATSPEAQLKTMIANLPEKTGKPLEAWLEILGQSGLEKHGELMKVLKGEHGMSHGFANTVVQLFRQGGAPPAETDLVQAQYAGAKADLKPIFDALAEAVGAFGSDVELAAKKTYVSLRRSKQFGLIQPSTKTRLDVGINLKGDEPTERLEASGSFNAMVSHRVRLASAADVDEELIAWLRMAYERA